MRSGPPGVGLSPPLTAMVSAPRPQHLSTSGLQRAVEGQGGHPSGEQLLVGAAGC